jgi:hypothetical protein
MQSMPAFQIRGPYLDKTTRRWRVRYFEGDKAKSESFTTREEALARMGELQPAAAAAPCSGLAAPTSKGSLAWCDRLSTVADELLRAQAAGDLDRAEELRKTGRVLASMAIGAGKHESTADIDRRLAELEEKANYETKVRKHGPKAQNALKPTSTPPVPGQPIEGLGFRGKQP